MKVPEPLEVGALRVVWLARGDRLGHRVELIARNASDGSQQIAPLFESIDTAAGEANSWPASPPLIEWHIEQQDGATVLMAVGRALRSHWSAAISVRTAHSSLSPGGRGAGGEGAVDDASAPLAAEISFDIACRASERPAWIGSRYRLFAQPQSLSQNHVDLAPSVIVSCDDSTTRLCVDEALQTLTVEPIAGGSGKTWPQTIRWRYKISIGAT